MSFISRWYYDLNPTDLELLGQLAERHGAHEPLRVLASDFSLRLAADDEGNARLLLAGITPPSLNGVMAGATPAGVLSTGALYFSDGPWTKLWRDTDNTSLRDALSYRPIPDVSHPITVGGQVYHRLALTDWAHNYPVPSERRQLIVALQDTPDIRNVVPLARRLIRERGNNYLTLVDDPKPRDSFTSLLTYYGRLPGTSTTLAAMAADRIGGSAAHLSITSLSDGVAVTELPSGAVLPDELLNTNIGNFAGTTREQLARKMYTLAYHEGFSHMHFRELAGLTLAGRELRNGNRGVSLHLLRRKGQPIPDLTAALAQLPDAVSAPLTPSLPDEDWRLIDRLLIQDGVAMLLKLPGERLGQRIVEYRRELDSAMERVARFSKSWSEAVAAEQKLAKGVTKEQVQSVTDSLIRAGKLRSLSVAGDTIHAYTNTIYVQDERSGAWHRMGDFHIAINTDSLDIKYENLTDPVSGLVYGTHPHIDNHGRACVGNFSLIASQLVAANDWLGLVEMCVVFLSNANTNDPAGCNLHRWPFVENPQDVGLPPYPSGFEGPVPLDERGYGDDDIDEGPDEGVVYDVDYETGFGRRSFHDIRDNPIGGDQLMLYSERLGDEAVFTYDEDEDDWFDEDGYNEHGFDRYGRDERGYDADGYDRYGYDEEGYDRHGYDEEGYDPDGYDREGYDRDGFDEAGYNKEGVNREGRRREEAVA